MIIMAMTTLTYKIYTQLYNEASKIFEKYGLTFESACVLFIKTSVYYGKFPFTFTEEDLRIAKGG